MNTPILDKGYIYVLINPSMEGLVKIGKTNRDPENRVKDSGATGVPTPFILAYKEFFENCTEAEKLIHNLLELKNYRLANNREFFKVSVNEAIKIVIQVKDDLNKKLLASDIEYPNKEDDLATSVLQEGLNYYFGLGDNLQDYNEAMVYLKKAVKLGAGQAYFLMGDMYSYGLGINSNIRLAIDCYKAGANAGDTKCYGKMASMYFLDTEHSVLKIVVSKRQKI